MEFLPQDVAPGLAQVIRLDHGSAVGAGEDVGAVGTAELVATVHELLQDVGKVLWHFEVQPLA